MTVPRRCATTSRRLRGGLAAVSVAAGILHAAPTAAAQAKVTAVQQIRLPFPQDDGTLTPYTFEVGYQLMTLVYDTLMWRDSAGVPRPWLARSVEVSPDGRQVTARLVEGVRWHDGQPLTAADVAFTLQFVATHPHPRFTAQVLPIERVETPDPATVVMTLRHTVPGFLDQPLADVPILPKHIWERLPSGQFAPGGLPVGSGPYRLAAHQPRQSYRFEANPDYFRGRPAVNVIDVPIITSAEETVKALERRQVDMIPVSLPENPQANIDSLGIRIARGDSYLGVVLMFNVRQPPFDRPELRQAVSKALDLGRITRNVGDTVPATRGYLHPRSPFAVAGDLHVSDEVAARAALAGRITEDVTVLAPDNDVVRMEAGRQVALALERAGVRAQMKAVPGPELARAVGEDGSRPAFQAAIWTVPPLASYDPGILARLFGSDPAQAPFNFSGYRSRRFDEVATQVATSPDPQTRRAAVGESLRILAADAPVVPLFFLGGAFAYRPAIYDGWVFVKGAGILDKRSFVEPRARPGGEDPGVLGQGGGGRLPFVLAALGLLAVGAVLGGVAIARGRGRSHS